MFCNENGQVLNLDINDSLIIGSGFYSDVYRVNQDTCFKHYTYRPERFTEDYIRYVRELDFHNLYRIYDLIYDENKRFSGYTMKLYKKIDIADQKQRYIYDSYMECMKVMERLSREKLYLYDLHEDNMVVSNEGLIIIDCDNMYKCFNQETAAIDNYRVLRSTISEIIASSIAFGSYEKHYLKNELIRLLCNDPEFFNTSSKVKTLRRI